MTTYTSEPGTRLGGRYRLEDRIAAGSGWAAWKAIDETLARAVTVFTFAQGFPRISEVVTAARAASRLTDPRLAQVFDVEDAWDRAYIVMEWAAGETLDDLLSAGPIEPARAARMIAEAATALSSAHAAGIAHMCLLPGSVRWSQTGEVKVVGLGIDAALSGVTADDPVLADTYGLGCLLYAALTGCWPGPDYPPLPPAPLADGQPRSPRQVVAGIPLAFSDLACRAMQLSAREGSPPIVAPGEFARALTAALPPMPVPSAPPPPARRDQLDHGQDPPSDPYWPGRTFGRGAEARRAYDGYESAGWQSDGRDDPEGDRRRHEDSYPSGQGLRPRRGLQLLGAKKLPVGVLAGAAVLVAVAAIVTVSLWPSGSPSQAGGHHKTGHSVRPSSVIALKPVQATGFDPLSSFKDDPHNENTQYAPYAIDANSRTAWASQWYRTADFGSLKSGSGLLLDMGNPVTFRSVSVTFGSIQPGADVKLLVANSTARTEANLDSMKTLASAQDATGTVNFRAKGTVSGRYLVIWFTKLPPKAGGHWFMAEVYNVVVRGVR
ncbi:MAG TPA: protein kinase family protein [Streptosporangiaceae bacterium]|nr:protein kinase family protein [Streptosporangiaceae bacterium]